MENQQRLWHIIVMISIGVLLTGCGLAPSDPSAPATATTALDEEATATAQRATPTATASPSADDVGSDWATYVNETYGFSFRYPTAWQLMEGRNFVNLNRGTVGLVIGYRHVTEDPNICCRQRFPEGELVTTGSVTCQGEEIERALLRCEGRTKAVLYQGTEEVAVGDLRFLFYLEDFNADFSAASIPQDVGREVDRIIGSLETFEAAREFATPTSQPTRLPPTPEPTATPASPTPSVTPPPRAVAEAQPDGANVRTGPGTDYGLKETLEGGEQVQIVGRYGDWWQIVYGDGTAWIYDGVVRTSNTEDVPEVRAVPTKVPPSPTQIPTPAAPSAIAEKRWIDVDLSDQRLRAYEDGKPVRTIPVSTGLPRTPTVRGQYRIWIKLRYDDMSGPDYYLEDVPYVMYFYRGYGLHGTYWHSNFGQPMSHGCVNLPTSEAAWVFDFVDVGTLVNVHE